MTVSSPPNYRQCKKVNDACCQNCLYLRTYDVWFACVKHFCYVERSKVCDDYEDGTDYRFGLEFRPTTKKEYQLLKLAFKGKKGPQSSYKGYQASRTREKAEEKIEDRSEK